MSDNTILEALNLERKDPNTCITSVGSDHRYGEFLHGGFAAALLVHTALEHVKTTLQRIGEQHVISCQVQYLKPVNRSEIQLHVEHVRVGKANATLRIVLSQKNSPAVTGDVSLVDASANRGITHTLDTTLTPPPGQANLSRLATNSDPNWTLYHLPYSQTSQGQPLAHWNLYFTTAGPATSQIHDMWCSPHDPNSRITSLMLPLLADSYLRHSANFEPDSDFSYDACVARAKRSVNGDIRQTDLDKTVVTTWTATQFLSLNTVKQLPPEGVKWVLIRAVAKAIRAGRLIAEITILDKEMCIVAYAKIVDQLIPAGRWVKENRREGTGARIMKM